MEIKGTGYKTVYVYLLNRVEPRLIQRLCVIRHRGVFYLESFPNMLPLEGCHRPSPKASTGVEISHLHVGLGVF